MIQAWTTVRKEWRTIMCFRSCSSSSITLCGGFRSKGRTALTMNSILSRSCEAALFSTYRYREVRSAIEQILKSTYQLYIEKKFKKNSKVGIGEIKCSRKKINLVMIHWIYFQEDTFSIMKYFGHFMVSDKYKRSIWETGSKTTS